MDSSFLSILSRFGLWITQPEPSHAEAEPTHHDVLVMDGLCPSIFPVPVRVVAALIKKKIPVVEYGRFRQGLEAEEDEDSKFCRVCFEYIEKRDEIRELPNCKHVFHRECLDCWVDHNQITCPLCRCLLYPAKAGATTRIWITDSYVNT